MLNFFAKSKNLEELKKEYKKLAMMYHPDRGGNIEVMKEINIQYDNIFKKYKRYPIH